MGGLTEFLGQKVTLLQGLVGEKLGMIAQAAVVSTAIVSSKSTCSRGQHTRSKFDTNTHLVSIARHGRSLL